METLLGKILIGNEKRDAIHQPIIPLLTSGKLKAFDWVKLAVGGDKQKVCYCLKNDKNCIGYIDPYINDEIPSGSKVYVLLKSGLIGDMKHHWTSPFFTDDDIISKPDTKETNQKINTDNLTQDQYDALMSLGKLCKDYGMDFEFFKNFKTFKDEVKMDDLNDIISEFVYDNKGEGSGCLESIIDDIYKYLSEYINETLNEIDIYEIDYSCWGCD